jgi:hypothetical protein
LGLSTSLFGVEDDTTSQEGKPDHDDVSHNQYDHGITAPIMKMQSCGTNCGTLTLPERESKVPMTCIIQNDSGEVEVPLLLPQHCIMAFPQ